MTFNNSDLASKFVSVACSLHADEEIYRKKLRHLIAQVGNPKLEQQLLDAITHYRHAMFRLRVTQAFISCISQESDSAIKEYLFNEPRSESSHG